MQHVAQRGSGKYCMKAFSWARERKGGGLHDKIMGKRILYLEFHINSCNLLFGIGFVLSSPLTFASTSQI